MTKTLLIFAMLFSTSSLAGVYKCTDASGNTTYQSTPCEEQNQAYQVNVKTGSKVDLNRQEHQQELAEEQKRHQEQQERERLEQIEERNRAAREESAITLTVIKNNPAKYSAFAIPTYDPDKLPPLVKRFAERLPEIEKMRRAAAEKALATGQCQRVEADQLNAKSRMDRLVFLVDCSSGKSFFFDETELIEQ